MRLAPLLVALAPTLAGGALATPPVTVPRAAGPAVGRDPLRDLAGWIQREGRARAVLDPEDEDELFAILGEVRILLHGSPTRAAEAERLFLEVAALDWIPSAERERAREHGERAGRRAFLALQELDRLLRSPRGPAAIRRLALEVVGRPEENTARLRTVAAEALAGHHADEALGPLLAAAADDDPDLRRTAARALVGWREPAVHLLFLEALGEDDLPFSTIREHFEAVQGELGPQALTRLKAEAGRLYLSPDWREAALARALVETLRNEDAVPLLIESLATWRRREADGNGSRRIVHEIAEALKTRSNRSLGDDPEAWNRWWTAVQEGRVVAPEEGGELFSTATFFGLHAVSDRIVFVLDVSGSMKQVFGADGRTRYEEAVDQLLRWLQAAGPETRFGIVLFAERARRWRTGLVPATDNNLGLARSWLESREPEGGTDLAAGLAEALDLDRTGHFQIRRVEADTFVVLSDEERSHGTHWDLGWLEPIHEEAQTVFHCVQIGRERSQVLAGLAQRTGGSFVRVRE